MNRTLVFDCEVYVDYFLLAFMDADTLEVQHFELHDDQPFDVREVRLLIAKSRLVSFNGNNFDLPLIALALAGETCRQIKIAADKIIGNNLRHWQLGIDPPECNHIDLIDVAPGVASLKIYGGRMHAPRLQDLPIAPDASLAPAQRAELRAYCENDLSTTLALFRELEPQIALREQMGEHYGMDLRSKSDAQIAEGVIRHEVKKRMGRRLGKRDPFRLAGELFRYTPPEF